MTLPIKILSKFGGKKKQFLIQQITKILIMLIMIVYSRNLAVKMGLRGSVGYFAHYFYKFFETCFM
jgi:hypothetical protein